MFQGCEYFCNVLQQLETWAVSWTWYFLLNVDLSEPFRRRVEIGLGKTTHPRLSDLVLATRPMCLCLCTVGEVEEEVEEEVRKTTAPKVRRTKCCKDPGHGHRNSGTSDLYFTCSPASRVHNSPIRHNNKARFNWEKSSGSSSTVRKIGLLSDWEKKRLSKPNNWKLVFLFYFTWYIQSKSLKNTKVQIWTICNNSMTSRII